MSPDRIRRRGLSLLVALLALTTLALDVLGDPLPGEEDPEHVGWTELLPPLPAEYEPTTENLCKQGQMQCVDVLIKEMERRFRPLASSCDHDAVFSLTYLRTTEEYRRAVAQPSFFSDPAFLNHYDIVFAAYYFEAYDNWHGKNGNGKTNRAAVPEAWRLAFDAADRRAVSGSGNLLLGMSAHVNRDLPFVLAAIGMADPRGGSRKPDHDQVNHFLIKVVGPVISENAARFDPSMKTTSINGTSLDETALFQLLALWREEAWRNAERLVNARSDAERANVAQSIENMAAMKAQVLVAQNGYLPLVSSSAMRDAWCAKHWEGS